MSSEVDNKGILESTKYLDPRYSHLDEYVHKAYKSFWTPGKYEKLIHDVDAPYYFNRLNDVDKETIKRCILAVSVVEDKVKTYWSTLYQEIPQTLVGDVGSLLGQQETTHRRSYHSLAKELKIDVNEINNHPALDGRIKYLTKYVDNDSRIIGKKRILKKLVLFTSLVERCSLFTQFYILMSYAFHNKGLQTISALQTSTATEEDFHYSFGIDLINIIKKEYPKLWDDYLIELVTKNIKMAHQAELELIDWFFEKGIPDHLTKEEVVNFLNDNFNRVCVDLHLDMRFIVDEELYETKNSWFKKKVFITNEPDFFNNAVSGYSSTDEVVDIINFEF